MRKTKDWIDSFLTFSETIPSPDIFKRWSGISTIAAAMERRFFVDIGMGPLFPNLYVFLIAPPGVGKSALTSVARNLLSDLVTGGDDGLRLGAASLTSAAIIDELRDAIRKYYPENLLEFKTYNSLAIVSNELGVLLPTYDPAMMNNLTDIYDGHGYSERRRWDKSLNFKIDAPGINLLAGTTPGYMTQALPEGAWDQGFLSRCLLIFSGERMATPLFQFSEKKIEERAILVEDLKDIMQDVGGQMYFSEEAARAISAWHAAGGPPQPDHPRLQNYNTRRTAHLLKLCMISCCAAGGGLEISLEHYSRALDWLIEAEFFMPEIFKALVVNADGKAMDECWHFVWVEYVKFRRPMPEHRIHAFLAARIPVHNVERMLNVMVSAGMLKKELLADVGAAYTPAERSR